MISTYTYPTTSNRLTKVTPTGGTARNFTYDAAGATLTDSRTGALGLTYQHDVEGRLSKVYQTNNSAEGATYAYDARGRLSARTVTHASAPTSTTTVYVHDLNDHIIAELNASGQTLREYIWLDDMPVAVVDNVQSGSPVIYYVHVDHLMRPARMTAQDTSWVWDVIYAPFGGVSYIWSNPANIDLRFPGQWFQLESGLAYNWHRHYDATIGRYVQADPLGLKAMLSDGPSLYGYVGGNPIAYVDRQAGQRFFPYSTLAGRTPWIRPPLPRWPTNPAEPPGAGWEWRGRPQCPPGDPRGNWFKPETRESLRPDLEHQPPIDPHWDYKAPDGRWYRWFEDGRIIPKDAT